MPKQARFISMETDQVVQNYRHGETLVKATNYSIPTVGIYVNATGSVVVQLADSDPAELVTFTALPVGFYQLAVKLLDNASTATVIGLW